MKYYKRKLKNIPPSILEKWTKQILEDYDSEELLEILIEQTDKNQKCWLFDKMAEILQMEANVKMFKPKTIDEEIKFEAFILDIKPLLNERQDYLF